MIYGKIVEEHVLTSIFTACKFVEGLFRLIFFFFCINAHQMSIKIRNMLFETERMTKFWLKLDKHVQKCTYALEMLNVTH